VWSTIRDLVARGVTLFLTTQYLEEADALADHIVLIDHGRATAAGTPNELKARIGDQRVDVIAVDATGLDKLIDSLSANFELAIARERRMVSIPAPNDLADLNLVTAAVSGLGSLVDEIALRRPTLDDAFLALTGQSPDTVRASSDVEEAQV
jgi:ABC-type multidrug transport system ATPase subunit